MSYTTVNDKQSVLNPVLLPYLGGDYGSFAAAGGKVVEDVAEQDASAPELSIFLF